jgi:hypothetical protein
MESNITSFNNFIEERMQQIVNELNESLANEEVEIKLGKIRIENLPEKESDEKRMRNLTQYASEAKLITPEKVAKYLGL